MRAENKALAIAAFGFVVLMVVGTVGIYFGRVSTPPRTLPIWSGTEFSRSAPSSWAAHFTVYGGGTQIVGAWTAFNGLGYPTLIVVNGTVSRPSEDLVRCPELRNWPELNGTIDVAVDPGPHTIYWGVCAGASRIVITETVRLVRNGLA